MTAKHEALVAYSFGATASAFGVWAAIKGAPGPWMLAYLVGAACFIYGLWLERNPK